MALTCCPIMCSKLKITLLIGQPIAQLYWPAILQLISHLRFWRWQLNINIVHLMSLRQLRHDQCPSRLCVFCWKQAKQSINQLGISVFKSNVTPIFDPDNFVFPSGIYAMFSWNVYRWLHWDFSCKFFSSAKFTQWIKLDQRNGRTCGWWKC